MDKATTMLIVRFVVGDDFDALFLGLQWEIARRHLLKNTFLHNIFGFWRKFIPFSVIQEFETAKRNLRRSCQKVINKRRRENRFDDADLLGLILKAAQEFPEKISDEMIIDECVTFLTAGQDTTSSLLDWTVLYLGKYPDVQRKLREEVDTILAGGSLLETDLSHFKYCKMVFEEVLRLRTPVLAIKRLATEDRMLCGYKIPKGACVIPALIGVSLDPKMWPDPETFIPERFSDQNKKEPRHRFSFVPFSAGNRNCIGERFALQEFTIMMVNIIQNFEIIERDPKYDIVFGGSPTPQGLRSEFRYRTDK
eukprot:TRINITY_DN1653_c0_g1_i1.p1 TRINITY_DN1653_c0_g1~~TRINITY_DN1653_c0_g1_i1.p1  ORF type:complete len:309 (-),score=53.14 TRINITY_DN1653_c0_g1_i1:230-1156(-)